MATKYKVKVSKCLYGGCGDMIFHGAYYTKMDSAGEYSLFMSVNASIPFELNDPDKWHQVFWVIGNSSKKDPFSEYFGCSLKSTHNNSAENQPLNKVKDFHSYSFYSQIPLTTFHKRNKTEWVKDSRIWQ